MNDDFITSVDESEEGVEIDDDTFSGDDDDVLEEFGDLIEEDE